jgi:hypothetical protein
MTYGLRVEDEVLFIHLLVAADHVAVSAGLTKAAAKYHELGSGYTARVDGVHVLPGQRHVHVFLRGNELFALNADGTAHDQSHGVDIPGKVLKRLPDVCQWLKLPPNGCIASFVPATTAERLVEAEVRDQMSSGEWEIEVLDLSEPREDVSE